MSRPRAAVRAASDAPPWAHDLAAQVTDAIEAGSGAPVRLPRYASADLPGAGRYHGCLVHVTPTDRPAYSDGTVWRYLDGSVV
jgi:hypothetical protein